MAEVTAKSARNPSLILGDQTGGVLISCKIISGCAKPGLSAMRWAAVCRPDLTRQGPIEAVLETRISV
ncbi:MAG TPA: hypothetical protein P5186_10620 [Candidatus Paceibacterota bacterium]|nr:hypothetical protein [Verrucomicrobiota bacterium]HRY48490.1 hypothetical protein [Candidatus Paceibacterota bacterium]